MRYGMLQLRENEISLRKGLVVQRGCAP